MINQNRNKLLQEFQELIEYKFTNEALLREALTTKQRGNQTGEPHFEGLDTLGDALLKFIIILNMIDHGVRDREKLGETIKWVGNNFILQRIAKKFFNLDKYIIKLPSENISDTKILADIFEALIAAVYLDADRDYRVVGKHIINKFSGKLNTLMDD